MLELGSSVAQGRRAQSMQHKPRQTQRSRLLLATGRLSRARLRSRMNIVRNEFGVAGIVPASRNGTHWRRRRADLIVSSLFRSIGEDSLRVIGKHRLQSRRVSGAFAGVSNDRWLYSAPSSAAAGETPSFRPPRPRARSGSGYRIEDSVGVLGPSSRDSRRRGVHRIRSGCTPDDLSAATTDDVIVTESEDLDDSQSGGAHEGSSENEDVECKFETRKHVAKVIAHDSEYWGRSG